MSEIIGTFLSTERSGDRADAIAKAVYCSFCGFAQVRFDFAEGILDGIEIGRVLRQISQRRTGRFNRLAHTRYLVDRLLDLKPTDVEGSHLRATIAVTASDKLLVFLTRRDVAATNNESERALRPSVIFRRVTNGFRSEWGAKVYADLCSIVATGRLAGRTALAAIRDALAAPVPARTAA